MRDRIIDYIRRNRISTTEVADCLDKSGVLEGVAPLNRGHFSVGRVFWTYAWADSNWTVHEQIQAVNEGDVVVITPLDCGSRAVIGDLVAKYLLLYRQARAIVVDGNVRDAPRLIKENWPIWCAGVNPVGCFNAMPAVPPSPSKLSAGARYCEAVAVCDDCGVVIIEQRFQSSDFLERLAWIERQEDMWYECIDRHKLSTFDTVCLKKYPDKK
jgi:4-hydroxy-4-methyl-2-oxoglutarate aldolase